MKKILLDTNAYSNLLRGDTHVLDQLADADLIYMSVIVLGELYTGFKGGSRERENKTYLRKFLAKNSVEVLAANKETAELFGELKHNLKKSGTPIPINDIWIAAHCMEMGAVLLTYDAHFKQVSGLRIWDEIKS